MTPAEIRKYFIPVIEQAEELRDFFYTSKARFEKEESMIEKESVASPQKTEKRSRLSSMSSAVSSLLHLQGPPVQERETEKKKFMHKMPFVTVCLANTIVLRHHAYIIILKPSLKKVYNSV